MANQFNLLKDRRFAPLFVAQFTSAFNDNLFKTVLSVLVAYGAWGTGGFNPAMVVSLSMGLLILPFVIFAPLAGELADRFDKAVIVRRLKFIELFIAVAAVAALALNSTLFAAVVLFAFGAQAAFFSPAKYSILPQQMEDRELIGANALLNTGAYVGILTGMIIGGLLALPLMGRGFIAAIFLVSGVVGYLASRYIPSAPPVSSEARAPIQWNVVAEILKLIRYAMAQERKIFRAIIGCSWFYFVGATMLAQFPNFTSRVLHGDTSLLTLFMVVFSVGISIGGLLNEKLLRGRIDGSLARFAAVVMATFLVDLYAASAGSVGVRIIFDLLGLSIAGGIFVVPLKSIVQHEAAPEYRARALAASSMLDSLFILASSIICSALLSLGFEIPHLFLMLAVSGLTVAFYLRGLK